MTHGMGHGLLNAPTYYKNINEIHDFFIRKLASVRDGGMRQALAPSCKKVLESLSPELPQKLRNF